MITIYYTTPIPIDDIREWARKYSIEISGPMYSAYTKEFAITFRNEKDAVLFALWCKQ